VSARLAAIAERAAPAGAAGPHLTAVEVERARAFDEDSALDVAYRHLAMCASCRARLTEPAPARPLPKPVEAEGGGPARARWQRSAWAAAAVVLLGIGFAVVKSARVPEHLAVAQRPYAGVMSPDSASAALSASTNLELSFTANEEISAFLIPCSEQGEVLSPPHWFAREDADRAVVAVAPRTFLPHSGKVFGFVVWGSERAVRRVADDMGKLASQASLPGLEAALGELSEAHGARMQKLELALP
jgi:hypothetical protein